MVEVFDSSGNVVAYLGSEGVQPRFRYDGQEMDGETGFTHNGARYYDPRDGRFISEDPSGLGPDAAPLSCVSA